jgi:hypothetical protein
VRGLAKVFQHGRKPWIEPDHARAEQVAEVIHRCPSGALRYTHKGTAGPNHAHPPGIRVRKDGPYEIRGGVPLRTSFWMEHASRQIYTLCRCGASRNKPFCDGSHGRIKFTDES